MNLIDRVLLYFAPRLAAKREFARMSIERYENGRMQMRKYEAASRAGRLSNWNVGTKSANADIKDTAAILKNRARDLIQNNPWAGHATEVITTLVVGDGIRPQLNHLRNNETKSVGRGKDLWADWSECPACDFEGERNVYQMQSAVMDAVVSDGEVFIIEHKLTPTEAAIVADKHGIEKMIPIQFQLLESDFLDHQKNEQFKDGSKIVQGVEYDARGRRVAYHFFKNHPGDVAVLNLTSRDTVRVPANQVDHVFRRDRLHQARGVSWFSKVMIRLRDLDIFEDATLRKQQISACYAGFIIDANGQEENSTDAEIAILEKLESGTVEILPPGKSMTFSDPPTAADYPEFTKAQLRAIAAGLGITYESLTQDLSNVNFSSGRMGQVGMSRNVRKWQNEIVIAQMMDPMFIRWRFAADLVTPGNMDMSALWIVWTRPAIGMIDPVKEVSANAQAISSGQTTLSDVLRSQGKDPEAVFAERAEELAILDELGIKTDSDPREAAAAEEEESETEDEEIQSEEENYEDQEDTDKSA